MHAETECLFTQQRGKKPYQLLIFPFSYQVCIGSELKELNIHIISIQMWQIANHSYQQRHPVGRRICLAPLAKPFRHINGDLLCPILGESITARPWQLPWNMSYSCMAKLLSPVLCLNDSGFPLFHMILTLVPIYFPWVEGTDTMMSHLLYQY